jgi:CheY-like chemotaxis protein
VQFVVRPAPTPLWVEADPSQLSQVLLNLITNAAEAIGDGTGTVTIAVGAEPTGRVRLSVSDTGPGIPDAVRERMFDPFFSTKGQGRGLGLSAVRGIVQGLGGQLDLDSAPGRGTRFDIWLPAAAAPAPVAAAPRLSPVSALAGTVLVVDDEAAIRTVVRRTLARRGCLVLEAADGPEGVTAFRANADTLSLVVLDLTMPGMSGAEVLAAIRATHPTLPVIIASGYDMEDAMPGIARDPHLRVLQKPFTTQALERAATDAMADAVGRAPTADDPAQR